MESKVGLDLDGDNTSIIKLSVRRSEDVRDKIAQSFQESFGHQSALCTVRFTSTTQGSEILIRPLPPFNEQASKEIWPISLEQMSQLMWLFSDYLGSCQVGIDWEALKKIHEEAEKKFKEMKNVNI